MVSAASGASDQGAWGVYRCVLSWRFQWDHRQPCPTSVAGHITDLAKSSFGGLRGLWAGCLRCLWMHLFKPVPMIPLTAGYITAFSQRRPYRPALTSSDETLHTDPYMWGERGCLKVAFFSLRRPSLADVASSESSFLCRKICADFGFYLSSLLSWEFDDLPWNPT